jgi:hypothetical protein
LWYTPESRFTQTIPLPGEGCACGALFAAGVAAAGGADAAGAGAEAAGAADEEAGGFAGAGVSAAAVEGDLRFEADDVGCGAAAAAGALPTVTSGVIFLMVAAETPAFDKSLAEEYGRPETIFFAVAAPTPGNVSKSFSLAVFRSTGAVGSLDAAGFADAAGLLAVGFAGAAAGAALPKVTNGVIFLMVAAETPAFVKSLADE